jgi:hypothetical protein
MLRLLTIGVLLAGAAVFGLLLTLAQFLKILQPLIVALSIMAAALLVRLNRGMPTLDWKGLDVNDRKMLTQKIVELTREYMVVLSAQAVTLIVLLVLATKEPTALSSPTQKGIMALAGALVALCGARMAYIVWRDYDIVRIQKKLIDDSADREAVDKASQDALSKVASIRASGLPRVGPSQTARIPVGTLRIEAYRAGMGQHPDTWTAEGVKEGLIRFQPASPLPWSNWASSSKP